MSPKSVIAVQRYYPQIYGACHVDHVRSRSTVHRLSAQDSSLLAHLDETIPIRTGRLARHLSVAASTLSAAIKRLAALGYLNRVRSPRDRREVDLRITPKGMKAMESTSVLDWARVEGMLRMLSPAERRRALAGLGLLAEASRRFQLNHPNRRNRS